jgi:hypothetical protein
MICSLDLTCKNTTLASLNERFSQKQYTSQHQDHITQSSTNHYLQTKSMPTMSGVAQGFKLLLASTAAWAAASRAMGTRKGEQLT